MDKINTKHGKTLAMTTTPPSRPPPPLTNPIIVKTGEKIQKHEYKAEHIVDIKWRVEKTHCQLGKVRGMPDRNNIVSEAGGKRFIQLPGQCGVIALERGARELPSHTVPERPPDLRTTRLSTPRVLPTARVLPIPRVLY